MTLRIIGAGFGRTGTLSLKKALEMLGFAKCYHMAEVAEHPEHTELWRAAWRGEEPWSELFHGCQAAVDWPVAAFWGRLLHVCPDAKVVLTERDAEGWYDSAAATIFQSMKDGLRSADASRRQRMEMAWEIIVDGTFNGDLDNRANAIAAFKANVAEVHRKVSEQRLIVFDPKEGWEPLCRGLGVAVPDVPYPHVNTTGEFVHRWRAGAPGRNMDRRSAAP